MSSIVCISQKSGHVPAHEYEGKGAKGGLYLVMQAAMRLPTLSTCARHSVTMQSFKSDRHKALEAECMAALHMMYRDFHSHFLTLKCCESQTMRIQHCENHTFRMICAFCLKKENASQHCEHHTRYLAEAYGDGGGTCASSCFML